MTTSTMPIAVCALYQFVSLTDYVDLKPKFHDQLNKHQIRGTLLLAAEGINGTIAGSRSSIDAFLEWLQTDQRFAGIDTSCLIIKNRPFIAPKLSSKKKSSLWESTT